MVDKTRRGFLGESVKAGLGIFGVSASSLEPGTRDNNFSEKENEGSNDFLTGTVMPQSEYMFKEDTLVLVRDSTERQEGVAYFPVSSIEDSSYQADLLELTRDGMVIREDDLNGSMDETWSQIKADSYDLGDFRFDIGAYNQNEEELYSQSIDKWMRIGW